MLTHKYRRIYYYHLKKCGGSTLNHWLDTLTFDSRTQNPAWIGSWLLGDRLLETSPARAAIDAARARSMFHWADVVHSHAAIRRYVPPGTLSMTMLRDPVERLISQVTDWRRLRPEDVANEIAPVAACVLDSGKLPLRDLLRRHAYGDGGQRYLDNYMTRALAAGQLGRLVLDISDPERLLEIALQSLETDYDFVGITEKHELSRNALCALTGLAPPRRLPALNVSRESGTSSPECEGPADLLDDLTRTDKVLYEHACRLFEQRHRHAAETYDSLEFERHHAATLLSELRGSHHEGATRYSVRDPIVGSGFHGRDGARQPDCAVWTGPDRSTTLYIPTPPDMPLSLLVWIRGFVSAEQRAEVRVKVDGKHLPHRFDAADGYADVLVVDARSSRSFARLDIEVEETRCSGAPGTDLHDPRKRGLAFDSYGWRAN